MPVCRHTGSKSPFVLRSKPSGKLRLPRSLTVFHTSTYGSGTITVPRLTQGQWLPLNAAKHFSFRYDDNGPYMRVRLQNTANTDMQVPIAILQI
jgi:hypothetical protein